MLLICRWWKDNEVVSPRLWHSLLHFRARLPSYLSHWTNLPSLDRLLVVPGIETASLFHMLYSLFTGSYPCASHPSKQSSHTGKPVTSASSLPRVFLTRHPFWHSFQWWLTFQCGQPLPRMPFISFQTLHFASYIWIPCSPNHLSFWSCTFFTGVLGGCDGS